MLLKKVFLIKTLILTISVFHPYGGEPNIRNETSIINYVKVLREIWRWYLKHLREIIWYIRLISNALLGVVCLQLLPHLLV